MKKSHVIWILAGMTLFLSLFSCKSTPARSAPGGETDQANEWKSLAEEKEQAAKTEQTKALEIFANVAMKSDYDAALGMYDQGSRAYRNGDYKTAYEDYSRAETMFAAVYQSTLQKRESTVTLMQEAAKKIRESGALALTVQAELAGGNI